MKKPSDAVIWLVYTLFVFSFFVQLTDLVSAIYRTFGMIAVQLMIFYANMQVFLPKYFKSNISKYVGGNLFLLIISFFVNNLVLFNAPEGANYDIAFSHTSLTYVKSWWVDMIWMTTAPSILCILISLVVYSYRKAQVADKRKLMLIESEKAFLLMQINPHFLFNTLNNIYSMTIMNDPKGSEAIIVLSKMLDYSLYMSRQKLVRVEKEIAYINNFINLFLLKDEDIENIYFNYEHVKKGMKIPPMLLIPFIENAFKHGDVDKDTQGFVHIKMFSENNHFYFTCLNSFSKNKVIDCRKEGIGIKNVARRLELLYPEKHNLEISQDGNVYLVKLDLDLS
ncbi:sensor histidine kinase [Aureibacter tunicatorum]|uniref:Signal transduction histidine kinase internal region domain-containing protein n=1 Tax=Aureibacter tunicatorum TaxID=866807 RepID=A0AAE3XRM9_9BACT|nr:histidine kinase [Aureibacter tunicatorum]MDR6240803.1 hypothetical protein [Aureibacter tunicatorum]